MRLHMKSRFVAIMSAVALVITGLVTTLAPTTSQAAPGVNVALASAGAVVSASGNESATWPFSLATDGDVTTRWSSNTADNAWLQVKLASATTIDHVTIL